MLKVLNVLLIVGAGIAFAGCDRSEDAGKRNGRLERLRLPEADPAMDKAVAEARRTVPEFLSTLQSPAPGQRTFAVKIALVEDGAHEHIWLGDLRYDGKLIHGSVSNEPVDVKGAKSNDRASVAPSAIADWMFVENGQLVGGYTIRLQYARASLEEKARLKAQSPFRVE